MRLQSWDSSKMRLKRKGNNHRVGQGARTARKSQAEISAWCYLAAGEEVEDIQAARQEHTSFLIFCFFVFRCWSGHYIVCIFYLLISTMSQHLCYYAYTSEKETKTYTFQ